MTYCLGIVTDEGLVMASDSRSNAGFDQVNVCRKMYRFVQEGERVFVILTSGSLSISQSIMSLLRLDFDAGQGLAQARSMYQAARIVGECVRRVSEIDRASLERDSFTFNVNLLLGGQVRGEEPGLYLIYPQGNPLQATEDSPYLQLGECKYGRPILDRGIDMADLARGGGQVRAAVVRCDDAIERHRRAADRPAPVQEEHLRPSTRYRRLAAIDQDLNLIHASWEQSLRRAVEQLPEIHFERARSRAARGRRMARAPEGQRPELTSLAIFCF